MSRGTFHFVALVGQIHESETATIPDQPACCFQPNLKRVCSGKKTYLRPKDSNLCFFSKRRDKCTPDDSGIYTYIHIYIYIYIYISVIRIISTTAQAPLARVHGLPGEVQLQEAGGSVREHHRLGLTDSRRASGKPR